MKILEFAMYSPEFLSSFGDSLLALGRELKKYGDSMVVCFPEKKGWMKVFEDEGIKIEILPRELREGVPLVMDRIMSVLSFRTSKLLATIVKKHKIDIIHTHFWLETQVIACITKLFFCPKVKIVFHWRSPPHADALLTYGDAGGIQRRLLQIKRYIGNVGYRIMNASCVNRNVAISKYIQDILYKKGIKNVNLIYNGIDLNKYNPELVDVKLECPHHKSNIIGKISNFLPPKDHTTFVETAKLVLQKYPETKFALVGDGPTRPKVEDYAKVLGIMESLMFTGMQEDVYRVIKGCNFTVLSSLHEGFGNVICEAMALKKPVIATNVGGIPEIVKDGENGFLVPRKNPTAMAEKILFLIEHSEEVTRLGENARKLIEQKFTMDRWAREVRELFLSVKTL